MSKSVGNVIDPFALADAYGVDPLRYFFLREVPFGQDGNYSHEAIVNRINADLANDLGNLAQRSLTMIGKALRRHVAGAGRLQRRRQGDPGRRRRHDRDRARAHEDATAAPGAQRGLGGGRRRQPLFRVARRPGRWPRPIRSGRGRCSTSPPKCCDASPSWLSHLCRPRRRNFSSFSLFGPRNAASPSLTARNA